MKSLPPQVDWCLIENKLLQLQEQLEKSRLLSEQLELELKKAEYATESITVDTQRTGDLQFSLFEMTNVMAFLKWCDVSCHTVT